MSRYLLEHHHRPYECGVVFAAFKGHASPLRHRPTLASCGSGGHAIWWTVDADMEEAALALLPQYVAQRTTSSRVDQVEIPILETTHESGFVRRDGCDLYYEEHGDGVPILLIHPAGSTASTWGSVTTELARIGRVIAYDRRGNARSGGGPVRSACVHTADAAALLECLGAWASAVVVGTSAGATIAIDLAVRRPDLVRTVIAHEAPWRFSWRLPSVSQLAALVKIGSFALRGRPSDAAEALLRSAYSYRDGGSAWDDFPEEWRRAGRESGWAALADFRNSIGEYPSAADLATLRIPVVCSYGSRSPESMFLFASALAAAIPAARTHRIDDAGHAAPFDATTNFVELIAANVTS